MRKLDVITCKTCGKQMPRDEAAFSVLRKTGYRKVYPYCPEHYKEWQRNYHKKNYDVLAQKRAEYREKFRDFYAIDPAHYFSRFEKSFTNDKETGCWLWTGRTTEAGYPWFTIFGFDHYAHRLSLWVYRNEHIEDGKFVCHTCDRPSCVNPDHLFVGLPADNSRDMAIKGRAGRGVKQPSAVLSDEIVREMRIMKKSGFSDREIADKYGVAFGTVHSMLQGKTWKHVK